MKKIITSCLCTSFLFILSLTLFACNKEEYFKIYFVVDDYIYNTIDYDETNDFNFPTAPNKNGYTFEGWEYNDVIINSDFLENIQINEDIYIYASWSIIEYNIDYNLNGGESVSNPSTYTIEDENLPLLSPSKYGYNFVGWQTNDGNIIDTIDTKQCKDITLTAKWELITHNVHYNLDGGTNNSNNPTSFSQLEEIPLLAPEKRGYSFDGWYTDNNFTTKIEKISLYTENDINLYAKFNINNYSIQFKSNGGNEISTINLPYNTQVTLPAPNMLGYDFEGWYEDDQTFSVPYTFDHIIDRNVILYAKWDLHTYSINYFLDGGENLNNPENFTVLSDDISLTAPIKAGYKFDGWYLDQDFNTPITKLSMPIYNDVNLYAKFNINNYSIQFKSNGGNEISTINLPYNTQVTLPAPNMLGYDFEGWYEDDQTFSVPYTFDHIIDRNVILYAKWDLHTYSINYFLDGGENLNNPENFTVLSDDISLTAPIKAGYKFDGWYLDQDFNTPITKLSMPIYNDVNLYAKWTAIFNVEGNTIQALTEYGQTLSHIDVPSKINNIKITKISDYAFQGNTILESINFPETLTSIGKYAFASCITLQNIVIPSSLNSLGQYAFANCSSLKTITVSSYINAREDLAYFENAGSNDGLILYVKNTEKLSPYLLSNNSQLVEVNFLDNKIKTIGSHCFSGCSKLERVIGGSSIESIEEYAFGYCKNLKELPIYEGLSTIKIYAFAGCESIEVINLPSTLNYIESAAFRNCYSIKTINYKTSELIDLKSWDGIFSSDKPFSNQITVNIDENVTAIADYVFDNLPASQLNYCAKNLISYGENSFDDFGSSEGLNVIINDSVLTLPNHFLYKNDKIKEVTIGKNVSSIGRGAFCDCLNISKITYNAIDCQNNNSFAISSMYSANNDVEVVIGDEVKSLTNIRFGMSGRHIISLTLGKSLNVIGDWVLENCVFDTLYIPANVTFISKNAFYSGTFDVNSIIVDENNKIYTSKDFSGNNINAIVNKGTKQIILFTQNLILPDDGSVLSINNRSFAHFDNNKYVIIPKTIEFVENFVVSSSEKVPVFLEFEELPSWAKNISSNAEIYIYSETLISNNEQKYWHYDENNLPIINT